MKQLILTLMLALSCYYGYGQQKLPKFIIADSGGKYIRSTGITITRPAVLIYFQPDCEDCRQFTSLFTADGVFLRHYQVIMVTNSDIGKLKQFVTRFGLNGKKNVIAGTEGWAGSLQRRLDVRRFPFVAVYDRQRMLRAVLTGSDMKALYDELKKKILPL
jgi:hypothetical protein